MSATTDSGSLPDVDAGESLRSAVEASPEWSTRDAIAALDAELTPREKRLLCQDDFWLFVNLVSFNYLAPKPTQWEPVPAHVLHWDEQVETAPLNIILSARKHTKTTYVLAKIMHGCQYTQGFEALYWANTLPQIHARMSELDDMIEANPWLTQLHDGGEACGGSEYKEFQNGSRLHTTSVTGSAEGAHVNLSVGDDPLKEVGGIPDEEIEAWYSKVIEPMLNRGGQHVIVGTRKRPDDLYEILRTKNEDADWGLPSYQLREYPTIREPWLEKYGDRAGDLAPKELYTEVEAPALAEALDVPGDTLHLLWPDGRPVDWLKRKLGAQGRPYFLREFCMVFTQADDAIINRAAIDERCSIDAEPPAVVTTDSPYVQVAVGVDPATSVGTDSSSYVTAGVREDGTRDILNVFNAQQIKPSRFKSKLQELDLLYSPTDIVIEADGQQQYIVDDAVDFDRSLPIQSANTTVERHSWETGIPRIAYRVKQGGYNFYRQGDDHTEQLINALTTIVMEDGKLIGHTPDPVSALYQAEKAIDRSVTITTMDLSDGDDDEPSRDFQESELGQAVEDFRDRLGGRRGR